MSTGICPACGGWPGEPLAACASIHHVPDPELAYLSMSEDDASALATEVVRDPCATERERTLAKLLRRFLGEIEEASYGDDL